MTGLILSSIRIDQSADWDPYSILGISPAASVKEIRAAYRRLAKQLHSDAQGSDEAFLALKAAHDFLLDPMQRALWDKQKIRVTADMRKAAIARLNGLCQAIVVDIVDGERPPEFVNIPSLMKKELRSRLDTLERRRNRAKRALFNLSLMVGKTRRSGKGENIVAKVLEKQIESVKAILEEAEEEQRIGEVMLAELATYSCDVPEATAADARPDPFARAVFKSFIFS